MPFNYVSEIIKYIFNKNISFVILNEIIESTWHKEKHDTSKLQNMRANNILKQNPLGTLKINKLF